MHRKILPTALLYANDSEPIIGRTRLQKLVFLIEMEFQESEGQLPLSPNSYNFEPYDYGPFSKELYQDIDSLEEQNLVEELREEYREGEVRYEYNINDKGEEFVENNLSKEETEIVLSLAQEVKDEFNEMDLPDLIKEVYSRYPEYAKNSVY